MKFNPLPLSGAFIIDIEPFSDDRGMFARLFCANELSTIGHREPIVQINHSQTLTKGALRGMHFQRTPMTEIKIVACIRGSVFDVMIDLRKGSPTLLQWHGVTLTADDPRAVYIPKGFAHGFQVVEPNSELLYLHTEFYSPEHEGGVRYNDPMLNIQWPKEIADLSDRDKNHPLLSENFKGIDFEGGAS